MKLSVRLLVFTALSSALTAVGAFLKISIPPYPVPMTLQTFFVFMAGMLLPPKAAFLSQAVYITLGLLGVPVFAGGGGIGYILHPTFGYLLAFLACAPLISLLTRKFRVNGKSLRFYGLSLLIIAGTGLIGVLYMAAIYAIHIGTPLTISYAVYMFLIFIPPDAVKFMLCVLISGKIRKVIGAL